MAWALRRLRFLGVCILPLAATTAAGAVPALYFYPAPYRLPDGTLLPAILTVAPEQITSLMPEIREMRGVVLVAAWAQLCPARERYDFTLIDRALDYWGARQRKVVLNLSTMGPPVKHVGDGPTRFVSHTPDWVLREVRTYQAEEATFGVIAGMNVADGASHVQMQVPILDDKSFLADLAATVRALGRRFDGNRALAYVRISTGKLGEDNPIPPAGGGLQAVRAIPDFSIAGWLRGCERITEIYRDAFHATPLEFDISFLAAAYARTANQDERRQIDRFVSDLVAHGVFIAFNGLGAPGVEQALQFLQQARQAGGKIGLEAVGPITNPAMQDSAAVRQVLQAVKPDRLVLIGLDAGVLQVGRQGPGPANATTRAFIARQDRPIGVFAGLAEQVLKAAGY
jgi:hypothetical protein